MIKIVLYQQILKKFDKLFYSVTIGDYTVQDADGNPINAESVYKVWHFLS